MKRAKFKHWIALNRGCPSSQVGVELSRTITNATAPQRFSLRCKWSRVALSASAIQRHRHQEFLRFLRRLDSEFPETAELHLILDNYGTHGHERVRRWLAKHPRFVLHFIPTSSSWLNLVERWFGELSQKAVRRGAFRSVTDLEQAITEFMEAWNTNPTPFVWTASVESILEKLTRCRRRLEQVQPGCTTPKSRKQAQTYE